MTPSRKARLFRLAEARGGAAIVLVTALSASRLMTVSR